MFLFDIISRMSPWLTESKAFSRSINIMISFSFLARAISWISRRFAIIRSAPLPSVNPYCSSWSVMYGLICEYNHLSSTFIRKCLSAIGL